MPQKAGERWFCHVMAFAYYFETSQNRRISFSILFLFQNWSPAFFKYSTYSQMFWYGHFPYLILKMGHLKMYLINFQTEREPEMKILDFGAFQNKMHSKSHHVTKSSFTCFLGHFILLPVMTEKVKTVTEFYFVLSDF